MKFIVALASLLLATAIPASIAGDVDDFEIDVVSLRCLLVKVFVACCSFSAQQ